MKFLVKLNFILLISVYIGGFIGCSAEQTTEGINAPSK